MNICQTQVTFEPSNLFWSLTTTPQMKLNWLRNRYKKKLCTWDSL